VPRRSAEKLITVPICSAPPLTPDPAPGSCAI
jgi:hypothetical protein